MWISIGHILTDIKGKEALQFSQGFFDYCGHNLCDDILLYLKWMDCN